MAMSICAVAPGHQASRRRQLGMAVIADAPAAPHVAPGTHRHVAHIRVQRRTTITLRRRTPPGCTATATWPDLPVRGWGRTRTMGVPPPAPPPPGPPGTKGRSRGRGQTGSGCTVPQPWAHLLSRATSQDDPGAGLSPPPSCRWINAPARGRCRPPRHRAETSGSRVLLASDHGAIIP